MNKNDAENLMIFVAKSDQRYFDAIIAAYVKVYGKFHRNITHALLFFAIIYDNDVVIEKLKRKLKIELNKADVVAATTKLISLVNSAQYKDEDSTEKVFADWYNVVPGVRFFFVPYVFEAVIDRFKIGALEGLPVYPIKDGGKLPYYIRFLHVLCQVLSKRSAIGDIIDFLVRVNKENPTRAYIQSVAEFLDVKLFNYIENELLNGIGRKVNLWKSIIFFIDVQHLSYFIDRAKRGYWSRISEWENIRNITPEDYVLSVNESSVSNRRKNIIMHEVIENANNLGRPNATKWASEAEEIWNRVREEEEADNDDVEAADEVVDDNE